MRNAFLSDRNMVGYAVEGSIYSGFEKMYSGEV
jgi:hypothetical protein